jgi:hypothetical protein
MADSVSTRPRQEGDFRCLGRAGQGQLSAKPGNSHCRAMSGRSLTSATERPNSGRTRFLVDIDVVGWTVD